jgi:hypothetical protein
VLYVQNDDAAYVWWIESNDKGFVANLRTGGKNRSMLHQARCSHLYPPEPHKVHTGSYPKACSLDRSEVEQWATNQGFEVVLCPDCKP